MIPGPAHSCFFGGVRVARLFSFLCCAVFLVGSVLLVFLVFCVVLFFCCFWVFLGLLLSCVLSAECCCSLSGLPILDGTSVLSNVYLLKSYGCVKICNHITFQVQKVNLLYYIWNFCKSNTTSKCANCWSIRMYECFPI